MAAIYHFTDKSGYNAIRAAVEWRFKASQPPPETHPFGSYFTSLSPQTPNLAMRLRISREKTEFTFEFEDFGDLIPLAGGRGSFIFYSPKDYVVEKERQYYSGLSASWKSAEQT